MSGLLAPLIDAAPSPGQGGLWGGGAVDEAPLARLRVLAAHAPVPERLWLDRAGAWIGAALGRCRPVLPRLRRLARGVIAQGAGLEALDDAALDGRLRAAAAAVRLGRATAGNSIAPAELDGLACAAEVVRRQMGFRPHPEQIMGAIALLEGRMTEMATGEGKTVTATMAAIVSAWRGLPTHVVTANDYLAARDARTGAPLFARCGVSVASVTGDTAPEARAAAYRHDVVYTTAKDLLADHLRDGIAMGGAAHRVRFALAAARAEGAASLHGIAMRGVHQVIVDEADSVLIDEAVTPLIISAQRPDDLLTHAADQAVRLARALAPGQDWHLEAALRHVELTEAGRMRLVGLVRDLDPFWRRRDRAEELVQMALHAMHLLVQDQHYIVEDGKVVLVDELTGRLARQRNLSLGMQQVLEAALGLAVSDPADVQARLSFQRYFRRFARLGGMTGTAREARAELAGTYGLVTVTIPTHSRNRRRWLPTRVFATQAAKHAAVVADAARLSAEGRAVLIGVRSVAASDALAASAAQAAPGMAVAVLNALNDGAEAALVAAAGQPGAVTIATNMAGRGTDIPLAPAVRAGGGLHVIIAESNDFARIDRQLIGRCARQGDPGTCRRYVSRDEEVVRRFLPRWLRSLWAGLSRVPPPGNRWIAERMVALAQGRATRLAHRQRRNTLAFDTRIERSGI